MAGIFEDIGRFFTYCPPVYLFPREPNDLFNYENEDDTHSRNHFQIRYMGIKRYEALANFRETESSEVPDIPNYDNVHEREKLREREFVFYRGEQKHMTVCVREKDSNGKYYTYMNIPGRQPVQLNDYGVKLSIKNNNTGKNIYLRRGGRHSLVRLREEIPIRLSSFREDYTFRFYLDMDETDGEPPGEDGKTFEVAAEIIKYGDREDTVITTKRLTMTYSPYRGWTLTREGKLRQGGTGYLIDENDLYVLKDGLRVSREIVNRDRLEGSHIGHEQPGAGLTEILGARYSGTIPFELDTLTLLRQYDTEMPEVVYQAFQINRGYVSGSSWQDCTTRFPGIIQFKSIGRDETDIPIMVTRMGNGNAARKLVIAGPHGDERNAQRLIMAAQRHFTQQGGIPTDTALYFIPCLSPTMCFADARGIPNEFWENTEQEIPTKYTRSSAKVKVLTLFNKQARLKPGLTIPALYDALVKTVRDDIWEWNNVTGKGERINREIIMRTAIQDCNGEAFRNMTDYNSNNVDDYYPRHGVDANRDIRKSLESTRMFEGFIKELLTSTRPENIKVIMMHGYYSDGGVFGVYEVKSANKAEMVDGGKYFAHAIWAYLYNEPIGEIPEFYGNTETNPLGFAGEWNQVLYKDNRGILSVDIELPFSFDEGRRGQTDWRAYNANKVIEEFDGILARGQGNYFELLKAYDTEINDYKNRQQE
jgi:hypothetical protein